MSVTPYWQSECGEVTIYHGKCEDIMPQLTGPFDAIIADLPYGTTACKWDTRISFETLWACYKALVKRNGAVVLFAAQPFTSALVMSNPKWFRYEWVWEKNKPRSFLNAHQQPLRTHETVCVFSSGGVAPASGRNAMPYNPQGLKPYGKIAKRNPTGENYNHKTVGTTNYQEFTGYPRSVLRFAVAEKWEHPTQKPVAMLEYLVKTYTNEGEIVLDNTMGSGTTGVACINTGRRFVGIELSEEYCAIGQRRIEEALAKRQQMLLEVA